MERKKYEREEWRREIMVGRNPQFIGNEERKKVKIRKEGWMWRENEGKTMGIKGRKRQREIV